MIEKLRCVKCRLPVLRAKAYFVHPVNHRPVKIPYCRECYERAVHEVNSHPEWERNWASDDQDESVLENAVRREMDRSSEVPSD